MVSNVLMHREYSSTYQAKFIIERERMYVENANRAVNEGSITVNNLEPNSKNPIIAGFWCVIHMYNSNRLSSYTNHYYLLSHNNLLYPTVKLPQAVWLSHFHTVFITFPICCYVDEHFTTTHLWITLLSPLSSITTRKKHWNP